MAKDPAFLFYASDFLTGTIFFSDDQVGKYVRLLCSQHQHGGFIEKNSFNNLVGEDALLRSKFVETKHGFYNIRLSEEMEKRNKKSSNISEAAKETWKNRKENTKVIRSYNNSNTMVIRTEDENENEIEFKEKKESNYFLKYAPAELPEDQVQSAFQVKFNATGTSERQYLTSEWVRSMWKSFYETEKDGSEFYQNAGKVYQHFKNWLRKQKIKYDAKQPGSTSLAKIAALRNY